MDDASNLVTLAPVTTVWAWELGQKRNKKRIRPKAEPRDKSLVFMAISF
jgi:hypothetical protein